MGYKLEIASTIQVLRNKEASPYNVGLACGELLLSIRPLVAYHLDHTADFQNKPQNASVLTEEFTSAVDAHIQHLRRADGCYEKAPHAVEADRKGKRQRRKYLERYTSSIEASFKYVLRKELGDVFRKWTGEQTEYFNKGLDRGLTGTAWCRYPQDNVVLVVGEGDWASWMKGKCEELGLLEARANRRVLDDL